MRRLLFIVAIALSTAAHAQLDDSFSVMNNTGSTLGWDVLSAPSGGGGSADAPLVDGNINAIGSGPALISDQLTFAAGAATLIASVDARDISGASWPLRAGTVGTMAEAGSGSSPTTGRDLPFVESTARGVLFGGNGNKFYDAGSSGIGTDDYIFEWVGKVTNTSFTHSIINDNDGTNGFTLEYLSSGNMRIIHGSGVPVNVQFAVPVGSYNHVMCFADRNNNMRCDVNGVLGGQIGINGQTGSVNNANGLQIGGATYIGATGTGGETTAVARVWKCTNCINTTAEQDAIAQQRTYALAGITPSIAVVQLPIFIRATSAYLDLDRDGDGTRRMYLMGNGWPRVVRRNYGGMKVGLLDEPTVTNLVLNSIVLAAAEWTQTQATISSNGIASPESGETTADGVIPSAVSATHSDKTTTKIALGAATATVYAFAKIGNRNFSVVQVFDGAASNFSESFNVNTCAVGSNLAGTLTPFAENVGGGWCMIGFTFTSIATTYDVFLHSATDAANSNFAGDGTTVGTWFWQPNLVALNFPSSPVTTTAATATRNGEDFRVDPLNVITTLGTMEIQFVMPSLVGNVNNPRLITISDGTGTNPGIYFDPNGTNETRCEYYTSAVAQAQIAAATSYADATAHKMRMTWATNDVRCFYDDAQIGATDTSATMSTPATQFYIGRSPGGGQLGFVILRFRVFGSLKVGAGAIP